MRSRCVEVFFGSLSREQVKKIASDAAKKTDTEFGSEIFDMVATFADNGRDAVNIVQTAESVTKLEKRTRVECSDVEWVIETGKYSPRYEKHMINQARIGKVSGLAVYGSSQGCILDIEAVAEECDKGKGQVTVTGAIEEEEITNNRQKLKRKSSISSSVKNTVTVLKSQLGIAVDDYNIHINFPNCVPVDGPSAGIAIFCAVYSAIKNIPFEGDIALTGELSICGEVCGVGEVPLKIKAAVEAGAKKVIIPSANWQERFKDYETEIIPTDSIFQVLDVMKNQNQDKSSGIISKKSDNIGIISAEGVEIFRKK